MELIARLGDREESIEIERHGGLYRVRVGEAVYEVDATASGEMGRSYLIAGRQHEMVLKSLGNGRYEVSSAHGLSQVEVVDPLTHLAKASRSGQGGGSRGKVTAYMPGRVVELLVPEGEVVTAGQGVLVLEAMKMENEIPCEFDGTVTRIHVEPGQTVENGDLLFEVTPTADTSLPPSSK